MNRQPDYRVFLALGGNLGDPQRAFSTARHQLFSRQHMTGGRSSSLYQTPAVGGPKGQPDYLNAVLEIFTGLTPQELLSLCQAIEDQAGRQRNERWGPRTLDIDLLFYADWCINQPELQVPHPRLTKRHFVLLPLAQLAPTLVHPGTGLSVQQHLAMLGKATGICQLDVNW